jgi:membrane protease YdiL (CAAX protease family)
MKPRSGMAAALSWTPPGGAREVPPLRRLVEVTALVAVWMAVGTLMNDGGADTASASTLNWYLLLGIPLVAAFQLWGRRRPIRELWVRVGDLAIVRPMLFRILTVLIVIFPIYGLIKIITDSLPGEAAYTVYTIASFGGAAAAAYAYTHFGRETFKYLGLCLATAGVIGAGPHLLFELTHNASASHQVPTQPGGDFWFFCVSLLTYIPSLYVMEEVAFRGCFDSHIHHQGDRRGLLTAIYVSLLWGIWHAPVIGWDQIPILLAYQGVIGTFLSIYWRKSGNLGVTATTHALIDSVRNATVGAP